MARTMSQEPFCRGQGALTLQRQGGLRRDIPGIEADAQASSCSGVYLLVCNCLVLHPHLCLSNHKVPVLGLECSLPVSRHCCFHPS